MRAQCYLSVFYNAVVPDRKGRQYTIKYATLINKGKTWPSKTDAQSATTPANTEAPSPTPPQEGMEELFGTETTTSATPVPTA